jgi:hypothetical protein
MSAFNMSNSSVRIEKVILVESGTYQEQAIRPFVVDTNQAVLSQLHDATRGGMNLGVSAVQDIASQIISPSAVTEGVAAIKEGWTSRRFRGMMRVREEHPVMRGTSTQRIFYLYTDHCGISNIAGAIDREMRVYFNAETVISETMQNTAHGLKRLAKVQSSNQIVTPIDMMVNQAGLFNSATAHLCRPADIFAHGQTEAICERLQASGRFNGQINRFHDHRTMAGECGAFQYSSREDTSPVRFVSNTLGAFQHATHEAAMLNDDNFGNSRHNNKEFLFSEAQAYTANASIHTNTFLARLKESAGYMTRGFVTWGDMLNLFPELNAPGVAEFSMSNGNEKRSLNHVHQSHHFMGADPTSIAVSTLTQTIPSLMMDTFLRSVSIAMTNSTFNMGGGYSPYAISINDNGTRSIMQGVEMRPYIQEFERRLVVDVLNAITFNGNRQFAISVFSDLAGDTVVDISLDGEPSIRYVAPTFTDGLFTPVITRDGERARKISNDMLYMVQEVVPNDMRNQAEINTLFDPNAYMGQQQAPQAPEYQKYEHPNMGIVEAGTKSNAYDFSGL